MPTLKELLNAYGKASARKGHVNLGLGNNAGIELEVPHNDWTYRYAPPKDGFIVWFVRACNDVSVTGRYGRTYLYSGEGHGYYGGCIPVKKGDSVTIVYRQSDTAAEHHIWFSPFLYES